MSTDTPQAFVVERYAPGGELAALLAKLLEQPAGLARHLWSVYLPAEETVFSVYAGGSAEDVIAANAAAGLAFEQVTRAVVLAPMFLWPASGGNAAKEVTG